MGEGGAQGRVVGLEGWCQKGALDRGGQRVGEGRQVFGQRGVRAFEPGQGDDSKIRFALHGLSHYVSRPGAEEERASYAAALIRLMTAEKRPGAKAFLIRQLQLAGKDDAVEALGGCLRDAALVNPAAQALVAIGSPKAGSALRAALASEEAKRN